MMWASIFKVTSFLILCNSESTNGSLASNVALGKPAVQSSPFTSNGLAEHAVDGNRSGRFSDLSCTETKVQSNPWWRVDLQKSYVILRLFIVNRADCCGERLDNFEIRIGDSLENNGTDNPSCGSSYIIPHGGSKSISCHTLLKGRYVNIWIPGSDRRLTLCEVEVYPFIEADHFDKLYSNLAGHALTRHIITALDSGVSVWSCAVQCNAYPGCVSFNYDVTLGVCQLSNAVKADQASDLVPSISFVYHERVQSQAISAKDTL